jgi:hypothetical protein
MDALRTQGALLRWKKLHFGLSYKRLDRGTFKFPEPMADGAGYVEIDDGALEALLDGIEVSPAQRSDPKQVTEERMH